MIRFAIFSVLSAFLWACADKPAPVAPAAKASDFGSMFDSFKKGADSETPTAPADTSSTIADSTIADSTIADSTIADSTIADSTIADADSVEVDFELPPLDDPLDGWVDTGSVDGDRAALMAIWDTFGQNTRLRKWGTRSSLRKWEGVKVDDRGRVIELSVPLQNHFDRSVRVPLPADIGQLTQLRALEIFAFAGALPPEIGNLRMLERLNIIVWSEPDVVNTMPEEWGQLTQLRYMQIECNGCVGSIPASFGNLHNLEHLVMVAHNMTGPIPEGLGNLPRLKTLDLHGMIKLSGPFPASLDNLLSPANIKECFTV